MNKCVICGYYGQDNAGDEALLMAVLEILPSHLYPIVLSANPQKTRQDYQVESYSRIDIFNLLSTMGKHDYFIWGGGSLMQDSSSIRSPFFYATLMGYAKLQGITTIALAQGIGPLKHPFSQWLAKQVFRNFNAVSVRDQNSANILKDWNIDHIIAPDLVWGLSSQPFENLDTLKSPYVAVNLRSHSQLTDTILNNLIDALNLFQTATNTTILLIPFQKSKDLAIAKQINLKLKGENDIIMIENPRTLKGLFKQIKMTIGMRLHSLIMAAAEGSNCFALSYDPKVTTLMRELNLVGWTLPKIPEKPNLISDAWLKNYNQPQQLSIDDINSLQKKALLHKELLDNLIKTKNSF